GASSRSSTSVTNTLHHIDTTVTQTTSLGPGIILVGDDQSQTFFVAAGTTNINTNTHFESFFQISSQTNTITSPGATVETYLLQRILFLDLTAVYPAMFSGLPVAQAQRAGLLSAHNAIGDVNSRIFRAMLGPNDSAPPQGDGSLGDDVRIF